MRVIGMIPLLEARFVVHAQTHEANAARTPCQTATARTLRENVLAPTDFPAFDRSAVDGYAIGGVGERFQVVAQLGAGAVSPLSLSAGECARIFTGAMVPPGTVAVIMQEDVDRKGETVVVKQRGEATHIRRRGEDARKGDVLIPSGTRIGASEAALLAQIGMLQPLVSPAPRILHLVTGNELIDPSLSPAPGEIRDSNSTLMAALLTQSGADLVYQSRCPDSLPELVAAVEKPAADWDVLLISGGASVGDYDFGARALDELGFQIHFRKVNIRPGKPLVFATRGRQIAFVVPGNPVAHLVTFHLIIQHALDRLQGNEVPFALVSVALVSGIPSPPDQRETWSPARVSVCDGTLSARPLSWQSSGDLCGIGGTNGLLRVPPGSGAHAAGARLECLLLDHRI
jgi:molybdopterin molybdotransferase